MAALTIINPLDQPIGRRRLLQQLVAAIEDDQFERFRLIVAFAKSGPLLRMQSVIEAKRAKGFKIEAILGVDQQGTSTQALAFALKHFDATYITQEPNLTFHPKMYVFDGSGSARLFIGSNNLTVGGTETNFETAIQIEISLPDDAKVFKSFTDCWKELLPSNCPATKRLTKTMLSELERDGIVLDENLMRRSSSGSTGPSRSKAKRSGLKVKPASPLPARKVTKTSAAAPKKGGMVAPAVSSLSDPHAAQGFAIQINPHHNGEIFLSVRAALQNPAFFKWPFTGLTIPKSRKNAGYPQLTPDPHVRIVVYGAKQEPILELPDYQLNTVYYETNSEIRITASPLVGIVPEYSVMIMRKSESPSLDYDITIHTPKSPDFRSWVAVCNQTMPSGGKKVGGKKVARRFGWF